MRKYFFIMFFGWLLFSCDADKKSPEGTYVNQSSGNYSIAFDTLVVAAVAGTSVFSIDRKVSFRRIKKGILQSREYHLEKWIAVYDDHKQILTETRRGKIISYDPAKKELYINSAVYQKISE